MAVKKKEQALDKPLSTLEDLDAFCTKLVGHSIIENGDSTKITESHYYSTGIPIIDFALSGGIKDHTAITYVGAEGAGKTTAAYKTIAAFQKRFDGSSAERPKLYCAYVNMERAFDPVWAAKNEVNVAELKVIQPSIAEVAVDAACAAFENDQIVLVVFDSIASLVTEDEFDKSAEDNPRLGQVAAPANRMLRKISVLNSLAYHKASPKVFLMINQWRQGISIGPTPAARTMPGGKFVTHYASSIIEFYKSDEVMGMDENGIKISLANEHMFKTARKQRGNSIREGSFILVRSDNYVSKTYGYGLKSGQIDDYFVFVNFAQDFGYVSGAGTKWYLTDPVTEEAIDFGSKKAIVEYVRNNPATYELLKRKVLSLFRKSQGLTQDGWW